MVGQEHVSNPFGACWSTDWRKKNCSFQATLRLDYFFSSFCFFWWLFLLLKPQVRHLCSSFLPKKVRRGMGYKFLRTPIPTEIIYAVAVYRPAHEFNEKFTLLSQTAYSSGINPLTPMSDQDRISPYNIKTISRR